MKNAILLMTLGSFLFSCGHDINSGSSPTAAGGGPVGGSTGEPSSNTGGEQQGDASASGGSPSTGGQDDSGVSTSVGGTIAAGGSQGDSGGGSSVAVAQLQDVQAIFDERCVICHDASKKGLPAFPGLPLTDGASRAALVDRPASETCGGTLVVPGAPSQSYLIQKLTSTTPCEGAQMPRPYEVGHTVPLTSEQIDTISSWISAGALP